MALGENLRNARREAGFSQKQVAEMLNICTSIYSDYERDKREPQASRLTQLSSILNTSLDVLLETAFASESAAKGSYMVLEIANRSLPNVIPSESLEEAIKAANDLLADHAKQCGNLAAYMNGKGEGDEWCCATESNMNAWCNWDGMDWDAYIIHI